KPLVPLVLTAKCSRRSIPECGGVMSGSAATSQSPKRALMHAVCFHSGLKEHGLQAANSVYVLCGVLQPVRCNLRGFQLPCGNLQRQPEPREQRRGIKKRVPPADPIPFELDNDDGPRLEFIVVRQMIVSESGRAARRDRHQARSATDRPTSEQPSAHG